MEWCNGCYRNDNKKCEAFEKPFENCWAKETNKDKYIKDQEDIIIYNKGYQKGSTIAYRSLRRVKGAIE